MPENSSATEELERELSILQTGTDRHQAATVGPVSAEDPYFDPKHDPKKEPEKEPAEEEPAEEPDEEDAAKQGIHAVLRHP